MSEGKILATWDKSKIDGASYIVDYDGVSFETKENLVLVNVGKNNLLSVYAKINESISDERTVYFSDQPEPQTVPQPEPETEPELEPPSIEKRVLIEAKIICSDTPSVEYIKIKGAEI
jgi:hypothetical protein